MPSRRRILSALAPAALVLLALAGCGGDDEPTSASAATQTVTETVTVPAMTSATSTAAAPATPPDPDAPLSLQAAEQVLDARGYAPLGERDWRPDQQLKVLLGVSRSADPRAEQAFFFVGDTFIGTDTKDPSAAIEVAAQSDGSVTLSYGLYRPADQIDVPTGGTAEVTYRWDGSRLTPQDPIPASSPAAPLSRR
ncbi:MAG TPA: LppP/LprE family lipoprotein [Conexibacter sp.]|nr:LppP/LprE family lipoprotein [Conexibacter sp.]